MKVMRQTSACGKLWNSGEHGTRCGMQSWKLRCNLVDPVRSAELAGTGGRERRAAAAESSIQVKRAVGGGDELGGSGFGIARAFDDLLHHGGLVFPGDEEGDLGGVVQHGSGERDPPGVDLFDMVGHHEALRSCSVGRWGNSEAVCPLAPRPRRM